MIHPRLRLLAYLSLGLQIGLTVEQQIPLVVEDAHYEFQWPIHKIAVIGAGVGGLLTYRELSQSGFDVHVFERDHVPGGNWHYSDQAPADVHIPNVEPVNADYEPWLPPRTPFEEFYSDESHEASRERVRDHRGPKPIWASMSTNTPSISQEIREFPWPKGTPWTINHTHVSRYLRAFASWHSINVNDDGPISYNTRVEKVEKRADGTGWTLTLKRLVQTGDKTCHAVWYTQDFDAVVTASGRFNAPSVPNIPGLDAWAKKFPEKILHSRQYRRPGQLQNATVLVLGAGPSAIGITRDINGVAKQVYQSIRPSNSRSTLRQFQLSTLPSNVTRVSALKRLGDIQHATQLSEGQIELDNGTVITGIDWIVLGTGFRYTYPFLPQYHQRKDTEVASKPLVTDGTHVRSLYLDLFYIEEPTLGFMNVNERIPTFVYPELAAQALAKVWAKQAKLPTTAEMWRLHYKYVQEHGGYGKELQILSPEDLTERRRFFVAWLNEAALKHGGRQVSDYESYDELIKIWQAARYDNNVEDLFGVSSLGQA